MSSRVPILTRTRLHRRFTRQFSLPHLNIKPQSRISARRQKASLSITSYGVHVKGVLTTESTLIG
jgi:hypothetical protein